MARQFTVADSKYAKELVKLGFSDRLLTTPEDCETYVKHCNKYNMKFLKGSYGTIVHKDFGKYFKESNSRKIRCKLACINEETGRSKIDLSLDHTNLFKSKIEKDVYILTSSPYYTSPMDIQKETVDYPYSVYAIHPVFLDYHIFTTHSEMMHPFYDLSYAYTNANDEQMYEIDKTIYEDLGLYHSFLKIKGD